MPQMDVFVSVGGTATAEQEEFVRAVEQRLRSEGLTPHTLGRNAFGSEAPLKTISDMMGKCVGTVVIALERTWFAEGLERRNGPKERQLKNVSYPTPWNQIEAALSYSRDLPLLVILDESVQSEGLLEPGYDWYVQKILPTPSSLISSEFNGVLASWKQKLADQASKPKLYKNPAEMTIKELLAALKPAELWKVLGALIVIIGAASSAAVALSKLAS